MTWLTIAQCVTLIREVDGRGISHRQLRRRLERWDATAKGKLLRWRAAPGGVREVNAVVLRQLLRADPIERELELGEVHERIDALNNIVKALRGRVYTQNLRIKAQDEQLTAQKRVLDMLSTHSQILIEA